jgi:hypothetical protein
MTEIKSRVHPDPTEEVAMAMIAWHNGLLRIGKTKAEDVPLPWNLKALAWVTRKLGVGLLEMSCIYSAHPTRWGLYKGIMGMVAGKVWRWLRIY